MSVKSEIDEGDRPDISFPRLMQIKDASYGMLVVLFSGVGIGMVTYSNRVQYKVGLLDTDWCMSSFEDFTGTITLQND